ncbi:MAG: UvrD-helicase domain-containing protein [Bacteroidota bacterium]
MFDINDADIAYAEDILLKEGLSFDEERKTFIKDLTTLDLQAVPGSGKTTALLAKLLILEKHMPFADGFGILVISHTNAAVDEIHSRIGKHAPNLFRYPNFVGTIQSFVDTFLAVPFYVNQFKSKPYRIDNEIYDEQVEKFYHNTTNYSLKAYLDNQQDGLGFLKSIRLCTDGSLKSYINGDPNSFKLKNKTSKSYKGLQNFKVKLLNNGYLHFDDAYTLAEFQLAKVSHYHKLLQQRFKMVFVDEMQDMDIHQHNLLERIFYDNSSSISIFQRIGDINQAIYNGNAVYNNEIWSHREKTLQLNGSHRINNRLAPIIEFLGITKFSIEGRNRNADGSEIDIKPHIIVFDDNNKDNIIPEFAEIIMRLQVEGKIPSPSKHKFKAIAWRKEHEDVDKLGLADYWNNFSVSSTKAKIDYKVLEDYFLFYDREKETLEAVRKQILNAMLKVLRLENILDFENKAYTKRKLLNELKDTHFNAYEDLKLHIYNWSMLCINEKINDACLSFRNYIPTFLALWSKEINLSQSFVEGESDIKNEPKEIVENSNLYEKDNIRIEIGTVHSVKGQTHTATLYLETFFQGKYESEYLKNMFENSEINSSGVYIKQAMKMTYVGFSRPTHLFCMAIHKDRLETTLENMNRELWEIIELPT